MEKIVTLKQLAVACCARMENCDEAVIVSDIITDSRKLIIKIKDKGSGI